MAYVPLTVPPGMSRNGTEYSNAGRWHDGNLVRWNAGILRPVGGWTRLTSDSLAGAARALYIWRANNLDRRAAIGTHSKLYVYSAGSLADITPVGYTVGRMDSIPGRGYGYSIYGAGAYSVGGPVVSSLDATTWSLDNWGENLVACANTDGKIYQWALVAGTRAAVITTAPTGCQGILVTTERHLVALGAGGDRRNVSWCSSEDLTAWTPMSTNSAGSLQMDTNGKIVTAMRVRGQNVIWTEEDMHLLSYQGAPYYYGLQRFASFCGCIGPKAAVAVDVGAAWMSTNRFFMFDGVLRPIKCDVADYVFSDFNWGQRAKVVAAHNSRFSEVWWFYPSANSLEPDRYVIWNYNENHWATGNLRRTCWADAGVYENPFAVDTDGHLYEHENGWLADGAPLVSERFARCGPMEIGAGDQVMSVRQILPDEGAAGQVELTFYGRYMPEGAETQYGPFVLPPSTDARFTARQVGFSVSGAIDGDWRLGAVRLDVVPGGGR